MSWSRCAEFGHGSVISSPCLRWPFLVFSFYVCPNRSHLPPLLPNGAAGSNRLIAAFTGFPALAIPGGFTSGGLPMGLELMGRPFDEATIYKAAFAYEQGAKPRRLPPPVPPASRVNHRSPRPSGRPVRPSAPAMAATIAQRVVVVDTGNYYPRQRDGRIEAGMPESRWVEQQLGRPVIKAFNNIYARHLLERGKPAGVPGRIALPVAGDDDAAKTVVLKLVEELGFDGVDAGGLDKSWRQQPGTPVYTKDFDADGVRRGLYEASKDRAIEWRGTSNSPGTFTASA